MYQKPSSPKYNQVRETILESVLKNNPIVLGKPEVEKLMSNGASPDSTSAILVVHAPAKCVGTFASRLNQMLKKGGKLYVGPGLGNVVSMAVSAYGMKEIKEPNRENCTVLVKG